MPDWVIYSGSGIAGILIIVMLYIIWRVFWHGAARSWYEGKEKFNKKGG